MKIKEFENEYAKYTRGEPCDIALMLKFMPKLLDLARAVDRKYTCPATEYCLAEKVEQEAWEEVFGDVD